MNFTLRWQLLKREGMGLVAARAAARLDCIRAASRDMVPFAVSTETMQSALTMLHRQGAPAGVIDHWRSIMAAWPDTTVRNVVIEYVPRTRDYTTNTHPGFLARVKVPCLDYPWSMTGKALVLTPFKTSTVQGASMRVVGDVRSATDSERWIRRTIYSNEL